MIAVIDGFSPRGTRGREDARRTVIDLLERVAREGSGGVLLAEGEPGIGKSALLRGAVDEAATRGFSLAAGAADQLGRTIPLFALRVALGEPFARFTADCVERDDRAAPAWWIGRMRAHLEHQAAARPVLVCLDDVQWTCPVTLAALRTLSRALSRHPVAWVLAWSGTCEPGAGNLFDVLETDGAVRLAMSPLRDDEVAALLTDAFGASPDEGLLALAAEAAGNPSLLVELIGGLRDDGAVRSVEGRAVLTSSRLPERVRRVARRRLDGLSKPAQHLLMTTAVLGPSFRLEDAAAMIGERPAALLPIIEETTSAEITTAVADTFRFRHPLLRRAVHDMIPPPGRTALHRQYGQLLLGQGELPVQAAAHLLQAVRPGDQTSLADLDAAARQTRRTAPETAARLALRALELTPNADPGALPRSVAAAEALACAGRLDQAYRLARETLAKPLPPAAEIRLRCALSSVLCSRGQAAAASAEARTALAHPQLPTELRDQAATAQLRALAELHDETAGIAADAVLAASAEHDGQAVVAALVARAVNRWDAGHVGEALECLRGASRRAAGIAGDARHGQPLLALAAALIDLRQFDEAEELLAAGRSVTNAIGARAMPSILGARLHLARGRLDSASAAGERALATAQELGAYGQAATARCVLALTALRRGDIAAATQQMASHARGVTEDVSGCSRTETALIEARISDARGGAAAALGRIGQVGADLLSRPGLLLDAHASAPWLVRVALAGGDTRLAEAVARAVETLTLENPGYPSLTAAADHSLGLVMDDEARLAEAATLHPDPWSRASAAEDLGILQVRRADRGSALRRLAEANQGYESIGATADSARLRSRLRQLGVRRRHWTQSSGRPERGWESLTETQHKVSELTAQGLNNRQIAAGMYLSSSTVAFHLRQIFRKLDIGSRVELTRIVVERNLSPPFPQLERVIHARIAIRHFDESHELIESLLPCLNDKQCATLFMIFGKAISFLQGTGGGVMNTVRGRTAERRLIRDLLQRAQRGVGGVLLVEGEPGIGKSTLLRDAVGTAAELGFSLAVGAADPLGQAIPFFAVRRALGEPFARLTSESDERRQANAPMWWIGQMRDHLTQRAAATPVLVCVDDLQWSCAATLAAVRALTRDLRQHPVAWVLARSSAPHDDAGHLFDLLEKDGAGRVSLARLDQDAVTALVTDALGAPPDPGLLALAQQAAGNPSLLADLSAGLREDFAVRVVDGQATLTADQLPARLRRTALGRLEGLGPGARNLLVTASMLGPSFPLEDAAAMLGGTAAALLPAVEEMMTAGLLTAADDTFSFRHELLRRAVRDTIPAPGLRALHRQYGQLLLGRGGAAERAGDHLLLAAHGGSPASLADLDTAVARTLSSTPQTAADLAVRVLELTPPGGPDELPRAVAAAEALAAAGRLEPAGRIARDTLAKPLPSAAEARLRCALSSVLCSSGRARDAAAEASLVLAKPQLPSAVRDAAITAHLQALAGLRGEGAGPAIAPVLAIPDRFDGRAVVAALAADAALRWDRGQIGEGLELLRDAVRREARITLDARHLQPLLALAAALVDVRQLDQAEEILRIAESQPLDGTPAQAGLRILRARVQLAAGELTQAAGTAEEALAIAESLGAHGHSSAAHCVLGLIALRQGDLTSAALHVASDSVPGPHSAEAYARAEVTMVRAQVSQARDGAAAALGHIRHICADLGSHPGLLLGNPGTAPWLTRTALDAGHDELAAAVAQAAQALASANAGYPAIDAAAAHSRGLAEQDTALLAEAAERHPDPWTRASAAEDLGATYARRAEDRRAVERLTEAIEGYQAVGAAADMARVRRRLRKLGVRRRHWARSASRPEVGWESLTETEGAVAELVAQGLSNRDVAARMYVSVHTVAFYLRQIFRKLEIGSRVELARIVVERPGPAVETAGLGTGRVAVRRS